MAAMRATITVHVRSLGGATWDESWTAEKLAYFILMCDVPQPKFETAARIEWVPYAQNQYSWNKSALDEKAFCETSQTFPQSTPRPFVRANCDRVTLPFVDSQHVGVVAFDKTTKRAVEVLIELCQNDAQYVEFDYSWGRHIYQSRLDELKTRRLASDSGVRNDFRRVCSALVLELNGGKMIGRPVLMFCREGDFEVPISLWFES